MNNNTILRRITLLFKAVPKYVVILFCLTVVGMNLLSQIQLVSLPFLAINAGICISWIAFLILDVVTKHFGAKASNILSLLAAFSNLLVALIFYLLSLILKNPQFDIFVFSEWSILLASTIAFIISALTNNYLNIFVGKKIKVNPDSKPAFILRSYISTFFGQVVDNFLFVFLAFYIFPFIPTATQVHWSIWQCIGCSILGAIVELISEVIFSPLGYKIVQHWKKHEIGKEYIKANVELEKLSAYQIGELVNDKTFTSLEVVKYFENRINLKNKKLNAFTYTKFLEAEESANELDKRIANGEYIGPFAGVPFALKDFLDSKKGWSNSAGGIKDFNRIDEYDSLFTKAMEKLGGVAIGKTNAPTYGFRGTCDNYRYGPSKNPFNTKYNSGGSSGGSAVAVSGGLVPIAEGGDAGGSIRIPASWNNIFGFKASNGTVASHYQDYLDPNAFPFCMNGGLSKSVKDAAILLNEMQGYDKEDPYSVKKERIDYTKYLNQSIKGLKIAYTDDFGIYEVDKKIKKKIYSKAKSLEKLGAEVKRVDIKFSFDANYLSEIWSLAISMESAYECEMYQKEGLLDESNLPKELLYWNNRARKEKNRLNEYIKVKEEIKKVFDELFNEYDLIISPVTCCPPVKNDDNNNTLGPEYINDKKIDKLIGFCETFIVNFLGNPACSIPGGFMKHHLPIGLQMIGRYMDDETVLKVASNYENIHHFINQNNGKII